MKELQSATALAVFRPGLLIMVSATMVSRSPLRQAFSPEALGRLMIMYDECLQELLTWYSGSEPSDLNGMEITVAQRIMAAAADGAIDPVQIRQQALRGLIPQKAQLAMR